MASAPKKPLRTDRFLKTSLVTRYPTPLRYPGGKQKLAPLFLDILRLNNFYGAVYVEPFAGGAGVAMHLLLAGLVSGVVLNDLDRSIYSFWAAIKLHNKKLQSMIRRTPITLAEWDIQKQVQREKKSASVLDLAFSTLFLNRTNRSGILRAGVIGGRSQSGVYKLNARFDSERIAQRVARIEPYVSKIEVRCEDAVHFLREEERRKLRLFFVDPPYFKKSRDLYLSRYEPKDHERLSTVLQCDLSHPWILTYDNCAEARLLYSGYPMKVYSLSYTADQRRKGAEILVSSPGVRLPRRIQLK